MTIRPSFRSCLSHVAAVVLLLAGTKSFAVPPAQPPPYVGKHHSTPADHEAIAQVLEAYTQSVSTRDVSRFEALLLNRNIPFASTAIVNKADGSTAVDTRRYADFKAAVFDSGEALSQEFYNVHIAQDGDLAQASLDFVTTRTATGRGGYGWKVLHLLKVGGQWKIASEFYTVATVPEAR